jgi:hypothetical protein
MSIPAVVVLEAKRESVRTPLPVEKEIQSVRPVHAMCFY